MVNPQRWRRAILKRAAEKRSPPADVVAEFLPLISNRAGAITEAEARELAGGSEYGVREIMKAFKEE